MHHQTSSIKLTSYMVQLAVVVHQRHRLQIGLKIVRTANSHSQSFNIGRLRQKKNV